MSHCRPSLLPGSLLQDSCSKTVQGPLATVAAPAAPPWGLHSLQEAWIDDRVDVGHLVDLLDAQPEGGRLPGNGVNGAMSGSRAEVGLTLGQIHELHRRQVVLHAADGLMAVLGDDLEGAGVAGVDLVDGLVVRLDV